MLVVARKLRETGPLPAPQQSDYAQDEWLRGPSAATAASSGGARRALVRQLVKLGWIDRVRAGRERLQAWWQSGSALPAPDYERVDVHSLIGRRVGLS